MNDQNFKNLFLKIIIFVKFWKCSNKYYESTNFFFVFVLYCIQRKEFHR